MSDFLEQVIAERRNDVANARANTPESTLNLPARRNLRLRGRDVEGRLQNVFISDHGGDAFAVALRAAGPVAVIAEIKRRSPALGPLGETIDAAAIAKTYAEAGAAAISVLTEPRHWGGSLEDLVAVRDAVEIPILCKDVIVDEYQLVQARAAGADAVLLIAEALDDSTLRRLIDRARGLGLGVLVEAHEATAFGRAVATGAAVVGVNARNLRRPKEIDIGRIRQLHSFARADQILVAESGIESVNDAQRLPARVNAVLIGTALMRADDPGSLIHGVASIKRTVSV